jgi:uncharacterized membrane protein HdeD (DUF308 family)
MLDWITLKWSTLLVRGLIGIAFGVVAMAWPDETVTLVVVIWGCWALLDGVLILTVVGRAPGAAAKGVVIVAAAVALLVAFFAIARPGVAAATLTWFLGVWLVVRGVLEIVQAFTTDEPAGRWVLALGGLLDGAIGVLFMANPGTAVLGIAFLLGLLAFLWGLTLVAMAFFSRRASARSGADLADPAYG